MQTKSNLTFYETEKMFSSCGIEFSERKYYSLGLRKIGENHYTDLAMLLSDQCQHTTKIAIFSDDDSLTFKDTKEFSGSLFKQLTDACTYLSLCNQTAVKGTEWDEQADYPMEALREALLNALIHRDYSFSGSFVRVFSTAYDAHMLF